MTKSFCMLSLLLCFSVCQAAEAPKAQTPAPKPAAATEKTAEAAKPQAGTPDKQAAEKPATKDEAFVPTVQISEDLSVSFPADI